LQRLASTKPKISFTICIAYGEKIGGHSLKSLEGSIWMKLYQMAKELYFGSLILHSPVCSPRWHYFGLATEFRMLAGQSMAFRNLDSELNI
jgi:hypothetical protein